MRTRAADGAGVAIPKPVPASLARSCPRSFLGSRCSRRQDDRGCGANAAYLAGLSAAGGDLLRVGVVVD